VVIVPVTEDEMHHQKAAHREVQRHWSITRRIAGDGTGPGERTSLADGVSDGAGNARGESRASVSVADKFSGSRDPGARGRATTIPAGDPVCRPTKAAGSQRSAGAT